MVGAPLTQALGVIPFLKGWVSIVNKSLLSS